MESNASVASEPTTVRDAKPATIVREDRPKDDDTTAPKAVDTVDESSSSYISESEDDSGGDALLWCPKTNRNHGELVDWGLDLCPACFEKVKKPRPEPTPKTQPEPPVVHQRAQFRYSNKFLWSTGAEMFSEAWPDLLDLDSDRGKLAMTQEPTDELVLEIVTIVVTNLSPNARVRNNTNWIISNSSIGTQCVGREVIIHSRRVMDALQTLITYYPRLDLGGLSLHVSQPYALFYHHIDAIKAFLNAHHRLEEDQPENLPPTPHSKPAHPQTCDEETYKHLEIVREVIEQENLKEVQEEISRHHRNPAVATYSMLWLLFKPGTKVYVRRMGFPVSAGVVLSIQGGDLSPGKSEPFSIDYWTLKFDGARLGRCPHEFVVKPFVGERRISELEITPCSFYNAEDSGVLRDSLIDRGQKYWRFLPGSQVDYQGELPKDQSEWQGRVIIDPMTYYRYAYIDPDHPFMLRDPLLAPSFVGNIQDSRSEAQPPIRPPAPSMLPPNRPMPPMMPPPPGWKDPHLPSGSSQKWQIRGPPRNESGPWAEYDNLIPGPHTRSLELIDSVTGEKDMSRYLMCPSGVVGFDLKSRQWQLFDVACCHDVVFNHGAIDSLVMKEERKSVIKSLVHRYTAVDAPAGGTQVPKPWTADFIKNKGEGQIFLLHGSPGVGKTYTAECIAEATRRPLLSLTCGDIGTNEVMAERTLSKWFRLAEIWGAVMLLDEADVFLEKRSISDLQRNSLVSVFLRIVEYYRGILFLTTNRVGQFDDAFISRIHTVIHYENFSNDEQDRIWTQFFKKLEKERRKDMRIDRSAWKYVFENKDLRKIDWNGRQIRNAFQTAVAFAEYRFLQLKPEEKEEGEKASLEDQDFAKVCEMTVAFQRYMTSIHGGDEARRARIERIRDDKFKEASDS